MTTTSKQSRPLARAAWRLSTPNVTWLITDWFDRFENCSFFTHRQLSTLHRTELYSGSNYALATVQGFARMATNGKILSLEELSITLERHRTAGERIIHCHGVFDLLHIGHVRHFEQARKFGDVLVVTLTPDRFVNKGVGRPAFPEQLRAEFLAAITSVDYVAVNSWPTAVETIKPHPSGCIRQRQ